MKIAIFLDNDAMECGTNISVFCRKPPSPAMHTMQAARLFQNVDTVLQQYCDTLIHYHQNVKSHTSNAKF